MARWHSGRVKDYPEHFRTGLRPKEPTTIYYFFRGSGGGNRQPYARVNRGVDISSVIEKKANARVAGRNWGGPAGRDEEERRQNYIKGTSSSAQRFGLKQAEFFNYMTWRAR